MWMFSGGMLASTCKAIVDDSFFMPKITLSAAFWILFRDSNLDSAADATAVNRT